MKGSIVDLPCASWLFLFLVAPCLTRRTREPPPPPPVSRQFPVQRWVRVRLNQFMTSDTRTFPMRFYYNDEFPGPHIVINVGGEWKISPGWTVGGLPYHIAGRLKAGLFYTEHRFYGLTRPFKNTELPNLQFLTVDQALADLAQFIKYIKSDAFERGRYKSGKVLLMGCSYGGTMVTFMRRAYPHLVDAAFSDSGPLQAQVGFPEFLEVVATAIKEQGGKACLSIIETAMKQLVDLLATEGGPARVSKMFKTCTLIQTGTTLDVNTFFLGVLELIANYVTSARGPGYIPAACAALTNPYVSSPIQRLADWITTQVWAESCIESYTEQVANYRNTSYGSGVNDMRLWLYQLCLEFGWFTTTSSSRQPFPPTIPLEYFHQFCKDVFSVEFNEERLRHGVHRTNTIFGGLYHRPDHVISVSGSHDPWSSLAPNATHAHRTSPVYVVPRETHCRAFDDPENDDPEELIAARRAVLNFMYENVGPIPLSGATNIRATLVLLVAALMGLI